MYVLIKLSVLVFAINNARGDCDICVTLPLLTSPVRCPPCNQSEIDEISKNTPNDPSSEQPHPYVNNYRYLVTKSASCNAKPYNWTTCSVEAKPCNVSYKYRSIDGSCNNLQHPTWGMSGTAFSRLLPANYRNNKNLLPYQSNGKPKPLSRLLSREIFTDLNRPDSVTLVTMQWGQVVAHDTTLSSPINGNSIDCCNPTLIKNESECLPQIVPKDDVFFSQFGVQCISQIRTDRTMTGNCNYGPAAVRNSNTHIIDASLTYGSDNSTASSLREFTGGKLKIQKTQNGRSFLPNVDTDQINNQCFVKSVKEPCYAAGDVRTNQNTELTVLINVLNREHNQVADKLANLHPEWDDETVYQEARAIVIAIVQQITYGEWLELYVGKKSMKKFNLYPKSSGYTTYNNSINFMILDGFATSAYRIAHSGIQGHLSMLNYSRVQVNEINISDWMDRPKVIQDDNHYDQFLLGLTNQPMQKFDRYYSNQITNLLFHGFGPYGQDLIALDIERGRDHGLAPYIYYLQACTGYKVKTFADLKKVMSAKYASILEKFYNAVEDIDVIVGSLLEIHVANSRFGPTGLCITVEQFYRTKWGDRFWFEVGGQPHSFTKDQLQELRKATLSRLLCDNSDHVENVAVNSFLPPSPTNKIVSCRCIPKIDLNKWK